VLVPLVNRAQDARATTKLLYYYLRAFSLTFITGSL